MEKIASIGGFKSWKRSLKWGKDQITPEETLKELQKFSVDNEVDILSTSW